MRKIWYMLCNRLRLFLKKASKDGWFESSSVIHILKLLYDLISIEG